MAEALPDLFFRGDTPHGFVKRLMYKKYLQAFIAVALQASTGPYRALVVDGFAGKGRYSDEWPTDIEKCGSPVIAVMVALNFFYRKLHGEDKWWGLKEFYYSGEHHLELNSVRRPWCMNNPGQELTNLIKYDQISLIFVERESSNFRHLIENLYGVLKYFVSETYGNVQVYILNYGDFIHIRITDERYPVSCYVFNTNFVNFTRTYWIDCDLVDGSTLCTTFVDPFGYSHTPMQELQAYTGERKSVLINFMSSYINRFVRRNAEAVAMCYGIDDRVELMKKLFCGDAHATDDADAHATDDADAHATDDVDDPTGDDAVAVFVAEFVRGWDGDTVQRNNVVNCTENYERVLRARADSEFSVTFEMRGEGNAIIYHLVFITNHPMQLKNMKESMNKGTQYSDGLKLSDYEIVRKGHALNLGNIQDKWRVADAIFQKFRGCNGDDAVNIGEIEYFVLMDTPYLFGKKHLKIMMKELNPRIIDVRDSDGNHPNMRYTFPDAGQPWYISFRY